MKIRNSGFNICDSDSIRNQLRFGYGHPSVGGSWSRGLRSGALGFQIVITPFSPHFPAPPDSSTFPRTPISPFPTPTPTQHSSPPPQHPFHTPPHTQNILPHTLSPTPPHTFPHSQHIFPHFPLPLPTPQHISPLLSYFPQLLQQPKIPSPSILPPPLFPIGVIGLIASHLRTANCM